MLHNLIKLTTRVKDKSTQKTQLHILQRVGVHILEQVASGSVKYNPSYEQCQSFLF